MGNNSSKRQSPNNPKIVFNVGQNSSLPQIHRSSSFSHRAINAGQNTQSTAFVQTITGVLSSRLPRKKSNRSLRSVNSETSYSLDSADPIGRHFWWIMVKQHPSKLPLSLSVANFMTANSNSTRFYAFMSNLRRGNKKTALYGHTSAITTAVTTMANRRDTDEVDIDMDALLDKWPATETGQHLTKSLWKHQLYQFVLGELFIAPVLNLESVLDLGTGEGDWALSMAKELPHCQVIGMDSQNLFPYNHNLPNCRFVQANIIDGLSAYRKQFDLIYWRHRLTEIPSEFWHYCFSELFHSTRPGGWIQLTESDDRHLECGPVAGAINMLVHRFALANGVDLELLRQLSDILHTAGFINVERTVVSLPIGKWGGQIGTLLLQDNIAKLGTHRKAMMEAGITSEEEMDWLLAGYERETDITQTYYNVCIYTAQRPK